MKKTSIILFGILFMTKFIYLDGKQTNIVLIGSPGSGKGTFCQFLETLGYIRISTGDLLREEVFLRTKLGEEIKDIIAKGSLVKNEIVCELVKKKIDEASSRKNFFVLDGFPQNIEQFKFLKQLLEEKQLLDLVYFVYLEINPREALSRILSRLTCRICHAVCKYEGSKESCELCGGPLYKRACDNLIDSQRRIDLFYEKTYPILDQLISNFPLLIFNTEKNLEEVENDYKNTFF